MKDKRREDKRAMERHAASMGFSLWHCSLDLNPRITGHLTVGNLKG